MGEYIDARCGIVEGRRRDRTGFQFADIVIVHVLDLDSPAPGSEGPTKLTGSTRSISALALAVMNEFSKLSTHLPHPLP